MQQNGTNQKRLVASWTLYLSRHNHTKNGYCRLLIQDLAQESEKRCPHCEPLLFNENATLMNLYCHQFVMSNVQTATARMEYWRLARLYREKPVLLVVLLGKASVFVEFVALTTPCISLAPSTKTNAKPLCVRAESALL